VDRRVWCVPLRRFKTRSAAQPAVTDGMTASREVRYLAEYCVRLIRGSIRLSRAAIPRTFPTGKLWDPSDAVHPLLAQWISSSRRSTPLQRTGAPYLPLPLGRDAFHGVTWSLFATSIELVRYDGIPLPPPFRPRRFYALDGLHRARPAGCISTRRHVQGSPFRGFHFSLGRTSSSLACALSALPSETATDGCPSAPRSGALPSGPCSTRESIARRHSV